MRTQPLTSVVLFSFLLMFLCPVTLWAEGRIAEYEAATGLSQGEHYYLGHNVRTDRTWNKVSTANFLLPGAMLSWGTKVLIKKIDRNYLVFTVLETKKITVLFFTVAPFRPRN